jgi:outer membrane protein assembly factor BamD (BamD/ComL family)
MPDGERRETTALRAEHLAAATALYETVRADLEKERHRTTIRDLYLRNSYLFLGDCAFDAGDYAAAVKHYDAAKERYPRDPASLTAMTQIVAALLKQGRTAEAIVANTRAKRFYESLPESVWDDPALPMTRQAWQRWIDSQATLAAAIAAESAGSRASSALGGAAGSPSTGGKE